MTNFIRLTASGHSPQACLLFLLCLTGASLIASGNQQHRTIYNGQVTFLGKQRDKIAMCNPSSFVAFTEIGQRTRYGYCFCCVMIPRTSEGKPIYPSRFPRQFWGKTDIPALAVFTSDIARLHYQNQHQPVYAWEVITDEESNVISKITAAATELLTPFHPEKYSYTWKPRTVVKMSWKELSGIGVSRKRNSYDLYIAINGQETIAVYNFLEIAWVPPKDQLQVGFNVGNDFDFIPLSLPNDIKQLSKFSEVPGDLGHLMVLISSASPLRLGCIHDIEGTYELMVLPEYEATFLGGEILTVSGPCPKPGAAYSCEFDLLGTKLTTPALKFGNRYYLKCVVPRFKQTGRATLTLRSNEKAVANFRAFINIVRSSEKLPRLTIVEPFVWAQRDFPKKGLEITWDSSGFRDEQISLSVLGYSEAAELTEENHFKMMEKLQVENTGHFLLTPKNFHCKEAAVCAHHHMGYLSLTGRDSNKMKYTIWSNLTPLAWFANAALTSSQGKGWTDARCAQFEPKPLPHPWSDVACPCTLEEAQFNVNQFVETHDCPTIAGGCTKAVPPQLCFKAIAPRASWKFSTYLVSVCCFSKEDGFLLYSEDIGFDKKGNHGSRGALLKPTAHLPELSFYFRESLHFFYCCVWNEKAQFCPYFNLRRPTPKCRSFANGDLAATIGDPHIISFGNERYTLNLVGEFVLLRSRKLEVQGRFAKVGYRRVTFLTAAAFRADDIKICVLLPSSGGFFVAFRNGSKIDMQSGKFSTGGVRIVENHADGVLRVVIASGKQSVGSIMRRQHDSHYMDMETSINKALQGKTVGLLGRWQLIKSTTPIVKPDGTPFKPWNHDKISDLKQLAKYYKVKSERDSLFWYRPPWAFPVVNQPLEHQDPSPTDVAYDKIPAFCEDEKFCAFDYINYNKDKKVAKATLASVKNYDEKMQKKKKAVPSCGRPNMPAAVFNSHNFQANSNISVIGCRYGYTFQLLKKLVITCKAGPDKTYSWKPEPSVSVCQDVDAIIAGIPIIDNSRIKVQLYSVNFGSVIDGDTAIVIDKATSKKMTIQLAYIDAPELSQPGGQSAKKFLKKWIQDSYVNRKDGQRSSKFVARVFSKDGKGRFLAELLINQGNVNLYMVRTGFAWCDRSGCPGQYKRALISARRNGNGLWKQKNPIAPWIYRAEKSKHGKE